MYIRADGHIQAANAYAWLAEVIKNNFENNEEIPRLYEQAAIALVLQSGERFDLNMRIYTAELYTSAALAWTTLGNLHRAIVSYEHAMNMYCSANISEKMLETKTLVSALKSEIEADLSQNQEMSLYPGKHIKEQEKKSGYDIFDD